MEVITEGVETDKQMAFLKEQNCAEVHGYLYGKPVPATEFEARFTHPGKVNASSTP